MLLEGVGADRVHHSSYSLYFSNTTFNLRGGYQYHFDLFARRTLAIQTMGKTNDSGHNVDGFRGGLSATKHINLPNKLQLR